MTRITNTRPTPPKGPTPRQAEKKPKLTRQKLERLDANAEYLALHDVYLENNQVCSRPGCLGRAAQVHHICRGVHRAASLRNTETWLPACSQECHEWLESQPVRLQILVKLLYVQATIERLRQ